jgi:hypothetical protein
MQPTETRQSLLAGQRERFRLVDMQGDHEQHFGRERSEIIRSLQVGYICRAAPEGFDGQLTLFPRHGGFKTRFGEKLAVPARLAKH